MHLPKDGRIRLFSMCNTIASGEEHYEDTSSASFHAAAAARWKEWNAALPRKQRISRFLWRNKKRLIGLVAFFATALSWAVGVIGNEAALIGCLGTLWLATSD